uniref:Uncharacterized protein n=1 Tax=Phytophthora fragariae TaxID=53985 RepID=A0A6A3EAQ2_9STRA|nr:hypothetical protein PF009_g20546 [Phytophthora fragariae]
MGDRVAAVVKSRKSARGRKKLDRAVLCEHVSAVPVNERENHRKIQQASNTSSYLIQQLIKEGYMRRALRQTRSLLTASHKVARLKLAVNHVKLNGDGQYYFDPMFDVVHIDEKWLYVKKIAQRVYVLTGKDGTPLEEAPVHIQSLQSHTSPQTTEDLIKEVELAFAETTAETLNKTFLTLQLVMKEIMTNEGRNNYRLTHMHKDKLINAGQLHTTLMRDAEILFSAHSAIAMLSVEQIYAEQLRAAQPLPGTSLNL